MLQQFGESKISDFEVSVEIEQDVFGFQVSVDDLVVVQVAHRETDLEEVNPCLVLAQDLDLLEVREEVAARTELHGKDQEVFLELARYRLEGEVQFNDEGVLHVNHDLALVENYVLLVVVDNEPLLDHLQGVKILVQLVARFA